MKNARAFLAFCFFLVLSALPPPVLAAVQGKGVALVIGNSQYVHVVSLPNPGKDATLMASTLRGAGFDVVEGIDLNKQGMQEAIDQFTEKAFDADVAVIFYAGHGMQADNKNFLIPVDANLTSPAHLKTRTVEVDKLLAALPTGASVGVVILDACRDNPMSRTLAASLPASRSTMTLNRGLARVDAPSAGTGTGGILIAYSTDPGEVALDGKGVNSPYTAALAKYLTVPGLTIQSALTRVRGDVMTETDGRQRPWTSVSLGRDVFLGGEAAKGETASPVVAEGDAAAVAVAAKPSGEDVPDWEVEKRLWDEASKRNSLPYFEAYLAQYPNGKFAAIASLSIDQLRNQQVASAEPVASAIESTGSAIRTAVAVPDDAKKIVGNEITESAIGLDRDRKLDLQLRLQALGFNLGFADGSLGKRSRIAIGEWQAKHGMVQSMYLSRQQYDFLLLETDPMMAAVRAQHEAEQAARQPSGWVAPKQKDVKTRSYPQKQAAAPRQKQKYARKGGKSSGNRYVVRRVSPGGGNDFAKGLAVGAGLGLIGAIVNRH